MSSTLAGPLTDHCFTSVAHSGTPKGESITIAGVPTYLSAPQASAASAVETVILYFSDVFGPFYINAQLVQDYFLVCVLIGEAGFTVVGIDYFFGNPVHLHLKKSGFDRSTWRTKTAGALAHPAFLDEDHFEKLDEEDHTFPLASRRRAEDIMVARRSTYHFQVFSGVKHGFAVRCDPAIDTQRWAKEESAKGIVSWFDRFTV
ncbi:hypothetical protein EV424DRAFT_1474460 [Suillus variegatus]|nr:hypothetical protein EV424DRAFT_1474460 [Suillus variegatus]